MVHRLLEKLTTKDIKERGVSTRSLTSALNEINAIGDRLIAWSKLEVRICVMVFLLGAAAVAYADLVWAVWCCGQGEHAAGNDNVIEVPADKAKGDADREAFLTHPCGIAITTPPAGK